MKKGLPKAPFSVSQQALCFTILSIAKRQILSIHKLIVSRNEYGIIIVKSAVTMWPHARTRNFPGDSRIDSGDTS